MLPRPRHFTIQMAGSLFIEQVFTLAGVRRGSLPAAQCIIAAVAYPGKSANF
jgi:hypothetical protein